MLEVDGTRRTWPVSDFAWALWQRLHPGKPPGPAFVEARVVSPDAHLDMQAALQPFIDNGISKTINVAEDLPFAGFADLYRRAWRLGLKGCTVFRPNPVTGAILSPLGEGAAIGPDVPVRCCDLEREAD